MPEAGTMNRTVSIIYALCIVGAIQSFAFAQQTEQTVSPAPAEQQPAAENTKDSGLVTAGTLVAIIGSVLGAIAFFWKVTDAFANYLHIDLDLSIEEGFLIARTTVENKGTWSKRITNALLLVGPESEGPLDTATALLPDQQFEYTDDFKHIAIPTPCFEGERAVIQIRFYYKENKTISDEKIGYDCPVSLESFQEGKAYAVRFFIFGGWRLHRSTQRSFVIPKKA